MDNRERIIEEASVMFRTYGIRAVTMDMLAARMGISKRTIYEIFKDKDELLHNVLQWVGEKQQRYMASVFEGSENVIEAIFRLLDEMRERFLNMSPAFRLDVKKFHNAMVTKLRETGEIPNDDYNFTTSFLKRGIDEGIFRKEIDIDVTIKSLMGVQKVAENRDIFLAEDSPDEKVIRDFYVNYIRGISTPKGLELIDFYEKRNRKNFSR